MSRFLLLILFLLWLSWPARPAVHPSLVAGQLTLFLGIYALMVGIIAGWARLLARRIDGRRLHRDSVWFNNVLLSVRLLALAWFAVGVFALDWGVVVRWLLGPLQRWPIEGPGTLIATAPALLTWIALWWAQYPAERAMREQNLLRAIEVGGPVTAPPTLKQYLSAQIRLQLLFSVVPILLIITIRDTTIVTLWKSGMLNRLGSRDVVESVVSLGSACSVFLFAPAVLRHVLSTTPLPNSPLRDRLERICRQNNLRYRQILLWHTNNHMSNAAVMGVLPRWRYILMSDLLLETMTDEQIEAVFAHEVGHIVHWHMAWYAVFFITLMFALAGPGDWIAQAVSDVQLPRWLPEEVLATLTVAGTFILSFGFISRRFERQADVFAARMVELTRPANQALVDVQRTPMESHVGQYGATVFTSALRRVAVINNIPLVRTRPSGLGVRERCVHWMDLSVDLLHNWMHGSIPSRMAYLESLSADPALTARFDRVMFRVYALLLLALAAGAAIVAFR